MQLHTMASQITGVADTAALQQTLEQALTAGQFSAVANILDEFELMVR